ncbi:MAG: zinc ribbon domain-containing protein [Eubacterium sp.]|nr:zinc ribbon domain-containing protein [Eubacterium sp.]
MNCPKCGAPLDDGSLFCKSCGANFNETVITEQESNPVGETKEVNMQTEENKEINTQTEENKEAFRENTDKQPEVQTVVNTDTSNDIAENISSVLSGKNLKTIGLIAGTFFIIVGLSLVCTSDSSLRSAAFGADFYTYTYEGILEISEILVRIEKALGWAVAAIGAAIDVYVLFK